MNRIPPWKQDIKMTKGKKKGQFKQLHLTPDINTATILVTAPQITAMLARLASLRLFHTKDILPGTYPIRNWFHISCSKYKSKS